MASTKAATTSDWEVTKSFSSQAIQTLTTEIPIPNTEDETKKVKHGYANLMLGSKKLAHILGVGNLYEGAEDVASVSFDVVANLKLVEADFQFKLTEKSVPMETEEKEGMETRAKSPKKPKLAKDAQKQQRGTRWVLWSELKTIKPDQMHNGTAYIRTLKKDEATAPGTDQVYVVEVPIRFIVEFWIN